MSFLDSRIEIGAIISATTLSVSQMSNRFNFRQR